MAKTNFIDIFDNHFSENSNYLTTQIITYIGNKRKLLPLIDRGVKDVIDRLGKKRLTIFDGFSGSGITSRNFKSAAEKLYVNDLELYARIISKCYLSNSSEIDIDYIKDTVAYLNSHKLDNNEIGLIRKLYAPADDNNIRKGERVFYTNKNAQIIDNIRIMIDNFDQPYLFLAPLLSQTSVRTNTSGVFKGFYKDSKTGIGKFGGNDENCLSRIGGEIKLEVPVFSDHNCDYEIFQDDTNVVIEKLPEIDMAYYDPPYNQHPYGSNYFMLNIICSYKEPKEISKVSGIPNNWNKSDYNNSSAEKAFSSLIDNTRAKFILVSYNNEGIIPLSKIKDIMNTYGKVSIRDKTYNTFKGSRNLRNRSLNIKEFLFILEKK